MCGVFVARPGDLPAKLDRVLAGRERAVKLGASFDRVDALIGHRSLRVERGESGGQRHGHPVGLPGGPAEVVHGERLFDPLRNLLDALGHAHISDPHHPDEVLV